MGPGERKCCRRQQAFDPPGDEQSGVLDGPIQVAGLQVVLVFVVVCVFNSDDFDFRRVIRVDVELEEAVQRQVLAAVQNPKQVFLIRIDASLGIIELR